MLEFLAQNWGNIAAVAVIGLLAALAVIYIVRRKKKGQCAGCDMCSAKSSCPSRMGGAEGEKK